MRVEELINSVGRSELAIAVGVDPSYLTHVLNGRRDPPPRLLVGMRDALNRLISQDVPPVTLDEIAEYVDEMIVVGATS
jgi:transcriptional regulator with XRE-family HTH domain